MSACFLHFTPMVTSISSSSKLFPPYGRSHTRRPLKTLFAASCIGAKAAAKIPMPPINPNDPFLSKLASVAAKSPEKFLNRPVNPETPPYLDVFDSPTLMATPAQVSKPFQVVLKILVLFPLPLNLFTWVAMKLCFWWIGVVSQRFGLKGTYLQTVNLFNPGLWSGFDWGWWCNWHLYISCVSSYLAENFMLLLIYFKPMVHGVELVN